MGQWFHGDSRASGSHVLKYGFRTVSGSTGGVSLEAPVDDTANARAARAEATTPFMMAQRASVSRERNDAQQ